MRTDRSFDALRNVKMTDHYLMSPQGSVLIEMGNTKVICTASVEDSTARHLVGTGEEAPFSKADLMDLLDLAEKGCRELHEMQKAML